jgi:hypothetical protein
LRALCIERSLQQSASRPAYLIHGSNTVRKNFSENTAYEKELLMRQPSIVWGIIKFPIVVAQFAMSSCKTKLQMSWYIV